MRILLHVVYNNCYNKISELTNVPEWSVRNVKYETHIRFENYTAVVNEVSYGNRVYLIRNGHGTCAIIDIKELDELDKQKALNQLLIKLQGGGINVSI